MVLSKGCERAREISNRRAEPTRFGNMDEQKRLRVEIVTQLAQKEVVGGHKKQVDTVKNWFRTDRQGVVEGLIRELVRDPEAPLEGYGGSRDNVRLTSMADAKEFIEDEGGDLPWRLSER